MIKLIIFDLDGVLVEAKNIHFFSLNKALGPEYQIMWDEHLLLYDGLKTKEKLELLTLNKGLPKSDYSRIWNDKQKYTMMELMNLKPDHILKDTIESLYKLGFDLAVCSNSIGNTVNTVLKKLELIDYFKIILSNEDITNSKPHPEIYWTAIARMKCYPEETLIIEDSPHGLIAASKSGSHILRVKSPKDVTVKNIINHIEKITNNKNYAMEPKWTDDKLNVLIPMAGAGSRFEQAGYTFPKPLIEVNNVPMIQLVVENININARYFFVVQKSHREKYNLDVLLRMITPNCTIIETDGITEGAACTALLAKDYINSEDPLFFANSDQFVEWNSNEFMYKMSETQADGGIVTFNSTHPKWSFVKLDQNTGHVVEVAEKKPISDLATVGFYYWKHGSDFVKYAEEMIAKNIRVNNEFYVCPVFNQAIKSGKKIRTYQAKRMWGLGTPEDLTFFLENINK